MKRVEFQPGAALLTGILLFTLSREELAALLLAAGIHELGHVLALFLSSVQIEGIAFTVTGPILRVASVSQWYEEALAALSGPIFGLLLWAGIEPRWPLLGEVSLFLSLLNLLPIPPLDGGRALRAILTRAFGTADAAKVCRVLTVLFSTLLLLLGLFAALSGYGVTLSFFAAWLIVLACQAD